ncbi:MAG: sodium:calcium antiporter [Chloroflexi bacterium HGW-Chloroflexi-9]|nr:MAG: sodium:calcium antiporter [Chloroflexi bacterium HGW-Chloroflexi-9]
MAVSLGLLAVGLVVLVFAGDLLVRVAARIAFRFGLAPVVVGATVVAFGTSMPEMTVSVVGALQGAPGVAAGNVIGSNITNILLVLGLAAAIAPMSVNQRMPKVDIPILLAVTAWALFMFADGEVSRLEGVASLAFVALFTVAQLLWFASESGLEVPDAPGAARPRGRLSMDAMALIGAVVAMAVGSALFVTGAVDLAERAGISEFAIGATVVAIGTSLPEIITSAIAAWKREHDIAVGNVIGSNVFNVLAVLGAAGLARPILVDRSLFAFELPVMALSALFLFPLIWRRFRIGRTEGALLVAGWIAFTAITLVRGGGAA